MCQKGLMQNQQLYNRSALGNACFRSTPRLTARSQSRARHQRGTTCEQQSHDTSLHSAASTTSHTKSTVEPHRLERDGGHTASSSGIDFLIAASVPDFTPLRNGKGPRTWPKKADIYIVRTDGMSCSRETVRASGCLSFAHPSTQQQLLVWRERPRCVLVLKKLGDEQWDSYLRVLRYLGKEEDMRVIVEPHEYLKLSQQSDLDFVDTYNHDEAGRLHQHVDFVVCLGGDGTILHASSLFQRAIPPVVSFSAGSLGFLTNLSLKNVESDLRAVIYGCEELDQCSIGEDEMRGVHITLRMRLECRIVRQKQRDNSPQELYEVLNEVVVDRGANPYLAKIECWERDTLITKVQADGVMLATPTGSTAYSVAAGGSMVHPNVPAILFTPICPHSLSFRPVVLPDYAELELRIPADARCPAWVCFDGKQRQELQRGDSVVVRMSTNPVPTISKTDQTRDWFASLERCFGWNDRAEQKPLSYIDRGDGAF